MLERLILASVCFIILSGHMAGAASLKSRFVDNQNETISDSKTGLMWQKGDSYHELKRGLNWYDALD